MVHSISSSFASAMRIYITFVYLLANDDYLFKVYFNYSILRPVDHILLLRRRQRNEIL